MRAEGSRSAAIPAVESTVVIIGTVRLDGQYEIPWKTVILNIREINRKVRNTQGRDMLPLRSFYLARPEK
jgi:hypothetical protein